MRAIAIAFLALSPCLAACGGGKGGGGNNNQPAPMELLDQSFTPVPDVAFGIDAVDCAQTFRTAAAGQLTRVELLLSAPAMSMGMIRVDVRPQVAGEPDPNDANAFGFVELDMSALPTAATLISFDLSASNIVVTASQALAIVVQRIAGTGVPSIHGLNAGGYGNGLSFRRGGAVWGGNGTVDFGFQTFVLP